MTPGQLASLADIRANLAALCRDVQATRDEAYRHEKAPLRAELRALENAAASLAGAAGDRGLHP